MCAITLCRKTKGNKSSEHINVCVFSWNMFLFIIKYVLLRVYFIREDIKQKSGIHNRPHRRGSVYMFDRNMPYVWISCVRTWSGGILLWVYDLFTAMRLCISLTFRCVFVRCDYFMVESHSEMLWSWSKSRFFFLFLPLHTAFLFMLHSYSFSSSISAPPILGYSVCLQRPDVGDKRRWARQV